MNEHQGYSKQALAVLAQPEKIAFNVFDSRPCDLELKLENFCNAEDSGAIITLDTAEELASRIGVIGPWA
ncbi:MAG: hypothetical protein DBW67_02945 [SAR116 cluster bacterium]|nr:hypothetical protein [Paracoccaceae bacterium]MAW13364.1 hypothetical protein [Paracoccaceae bacterium]RCL80749.1 MAG: hypothetical protein DBW67_02945 [SAR116 cluster bacterium]